MAGCASGRQRWRPPRPGPRPGVLPAPRERHRRRHRALPARHRAGLLSGQALHPAGGAPPAPSGAGRLERLAGRAGGPGDQRAVHHRCPAGADAGLGAVQHALGPGAAHGRRQRRRRAGARLLRARDPHGQHHGGRLPGRRGWLVPFPLLSGDVERGTVQRPGADGDRAGDLRALASRALLLGRAAVRRRHRAGAGPAIGGDRTENPVYRAAQTSLPGANE